MQRIVVLVFEQRVVAKAGSDNTPQRVSIEIVIVGRSEDRGFALRTLCGRGIIGDRDIEERLVPLGCLNRQRLGPFHS